MRDDNNNLAGIDPVILRRYAWVSKEVERLTTEYTTRTHNKRKLIIAAVSLILSAVVALFFLRKKSVMVRAGAFVVVAPVLYFALVNLGYAANFFNLDRQALQDIQDDVDARAEANRIMFQ